MRRHRPNVVRLERVLCSCQRGVVDRLAAVDTRQARSATVRSVLTFQYSVAVSVAKVAHGVGVLRGRRVRNNARAAARWLGRQIRDDDAEGRQDRGAVPSLNPAADQVLGKIIRVR